MENKPKFTSGPWRKMAWGETISIDGAEIMGLAFLNPRGNHNAGIPSAEDSANASLISAAPEMYGVLKEVLDMLESSTPTKKRKEHIHFLVSAALMKAEGQP